MASQQAPARPWIRFASMNRPTAPVPAPATLAQPQPQPPARQPRPPFVRPTFRPPPPVAQPKAPAPPPAPPVAAAPPATASPPPQPPSPVAAPPPSTTSVPSSPIIKFYAASSSLPTSPAYTSSVPPSPDTKLFSASSSTLSTSPAPKVMSPPAPPSHLSAATATPTSSPKIISPLTKTSPLSPKMKPISTPPSPLVLPPTKIKFDGKPQTKIPAEAQQKTILMQETFEEAKVIPNTSTGNFEKHVNVVHNGKSEGKINKSFYHKYSDSDDFGNRVVTLSGENRGAIMELSLHKKGNPIALISNAQKSERESNEEGRSKMDDKTHKMVSPLKKTTFTNSNVQGVNNSILLDCSFSHYDPGVHLSLSGKPNGGGRGAQLKD